MLYEECPFCKKGKVIHKGISQTCSWCRGRGLALSLLYEEIEAIKLEKAYKRQLNAVRPVPQVESLDLTLNYEIYECPYCGGMEDYETEWDECLECGGSGELVIYKEL